MEAKETPAVRLSRKKKKQFIHGMESGSKKKKALRVGNSVGVPLAAEAQGLRR